MATTVQAALTEYYNKIDQIGKGSVPVSSIVPTSPTQFKYIESDHVIEGLPEQPKTQDYEVWYRNLTPGQKYLVDSLKEQQQGYNDQVIDQINKLTEENKDALYRSFSGEYFPASAQGMSKQEWMTRAKELEQFRQGDKMVADNIRNIFITNYGEEQGSQMWNEYKQGWYKNIEKLQTEFQKNEASLRQLPSTITPVQSRMQNFKDYWANVGKEWKEAVTNQKVPLVNQAGAEAVADTIAGAAQHIPFFAPFAAFSDATRPLSPETKKDIYVTGSKYARLPVVNLFTGAPYKLLSSSLTGKQFYEADKIEQVLQRAKPRYEQLVTEYNTLQQDYKDGKVGTDQYYGRMKEILSDRDWQDVQKYAGYTSRYADLVGEGGSVKNPFEKASIVGLRYAAPLTELFIPGGQATWIAREGSRSIADLGPNISQQNWMGTAGNIITIGTAGYLARAGLKEGTLFSALGSSGLKEAEALAAARRTAGESNFFRTAFRLGRYSVPLAFTGFNVYSGYKEAGVPGAIGAGVGTAGVMFGPTAFKATVGVQKPVLPLEGDYRYISNGKFIRGPFAPVTKTQSVTYFNEVTPDIAKANILLMSTTTPKLELTTTRWNLLKQKFPTFSLSSKAWNPLKGEQTYSAKLGRWNFGIGRRPLEVKTRRVGKPQVTLAFSNKILFMKGEQVTPASFITKSARGQRYLTRLYGGLSEKVPSKLLRRSSSETQELARAIAEEKTGVPNLGAFGVDRYVQVGFQEAKTIGKIGKTKGVDNWTFIKPLPSAKGARRGRTIERTNIAGISDEVKNPPAQLDFFGMKVNIPSGPEVRVSKEIFVGKDVTNRVRAGGRPPFRIRGVIIEKGLPSVEPTTGVNVTKNPRPVQQQAVSAKEKLLLVKGAMARKVLQKTSATAKVKEVSPQPVNVRPSPSMYAGTGQYERTETQMVSPLMKSAQMSISSSLIQPREIVKESLGTRTIPREQAREFSREEVRLSPKEIPREFVRTVPREIVRTQPREVVRERVGQLPAQVPLESPRPLQRTPSRQTPRTPTRPRIPRRPGGPRIFGGGGKNPLKTSSGKSRRGLGAYFVEVRKYKRPSLITQNPLIKSQALAVGLKYAKSTERATFRLVPTTANPVRSTIRPVTEAEVFKAGFRPPYRRGKAQPGLTFVQRRRTRMGTTAETKAIQRYKGNPYWRKGKSL